MVEPRTHAAVRRRTGLQRRLAGDLDVVDAVALGALEDGADAANGKLFVVDGGDGGAEVADVRTQQAPALGIEQETTPAWIERWLAQALRLSRDIDPFAARRLGDLVAMLEPEDRELLRPMLLLDDDDDAVGDPGVAGAVTAAVLP